MANDRQLERTISRWLEAEAPTQLPDRVLRATFERTRTSRQQRSWRALLWRNRIVMNRSIPIGLGSAAVVIVLLGGVMLFGSSGVGGPGPSPTPSPTPTATSTPTPAPSSTAEPTLSIGGGLPLGPYQIGQEVVPITVDIPSSGWMPITELQALSKADDGLDPPDTVGGALLAWAWPAGTGFNVYGDGCHWATTIPEMPATTPDEIAAALATQTSSDPTAPVAVTVGGYAGKAITLTVPMTYDLPNSTREQRFADCDQSQYGFYAGGADTEPTRNAQGAGQVDELWILDVNGVIVILDATYGPAASAELVGELRAMAESATFGG